MKLTNENAFVGAKVTYNGKQMTVIKVNAKSFYATEMTLSEFNEKYDNRLVGATFVAFCKSMDIFSYKYSDNFEIDEKEISRKKIAEINAKQSAYTINSIERKGIENTIKDFAKKKRNLKLYQFTPQKRLIRFLEIRDENNFLLNIDNDYVLYSIETQESIKISTVYDYNYKEVPWYKLSIYAEETLAA